VRTLGTSARSADLAHELGAVAKADICRARTKREKVAGVKIGLLGSGFGMATPASITVIPMSMKSWCSVARPRNCEGERR
jgi:hypothetical protein